MIYGAKEGMSIAGADPAAQQNFVGRNLRSIAFDRIISPITDRIPLVGDPIRMIANEVLFLGKAGEVWNATQIPNRGQIQEFRQSVTGRIIEPLVVGFAARQVGMLGAGYFPEIFLALYAGKSVQEYLNSEHLSMQSQKVGATLTSLSTGTLLYLMSGTPVTDWVIIPTATVFAAKAGLRLVGLDPSNGSHPLDSFEGRSFRCMIVDNLIKVVTDRIPIVGLPIRLLAGTVTAQAVPLYRTYQTTIGLSNYEDFNPAAFIYTWTFPAEGSSRITAMIQQLPIPGLIRNGLESYLTQGVEKSILPNSVIRAFNSYAKVLQSPEVLTLLKTYCTATDKTGIKKQLTDAIYNKITEDITLVEGLKTFASTWASPYITAAQILEPIKTLESSLIGFNIDHEAHGELIEILARGFSTQLLKSIRVKSKSQAVSLTQEEIREFYHNALHLLGSLYLHTTTEPATKEFLMEKADQLLMLFLESGAHITQFMYQRKRVEPFSQEDEALLS
jgi:hypothetical protein